MFKYLLNKFLARSVDQLIAKLTKLEARLQRAADEASVARDNARSAGVALLNQADDFAAEAERARRIARRVKELVQ